MNSLGEIVAGTNSNLFILEKKGEWMRNRSSSNKLFVGVAVDSTNDNVYAIIWDNPTAKIVKLSPELKLLQQCQVYERGSVYHSGVEVVGDKVMVCDQESNCVKVFTKDLKFVKDIDHRIHNIADVGDRLRRRDFGSKKMNSIRDISSDREGNLYISNVSKCAVHVFDNDGKFSESFRKGRTRKLRSPHGVCVHGKETQYMFVADAGGRGSDAAVMVFTTEGEYVTSFGEKHLEKPWGLCVDGDGFVYACDHDNNQVLIF